MQDWIEFAFKNGLAPTHSGPCQLCNSDVANGIYDCIGMASQVSNKLDHDEAVDKMTIFLCVDSHALQHSEIHGRWSNHFHLTRLYLILKSKIKWSYSFSPILSRVLDGYKINKESEIIENPSIGNRGVINIKDIYNSETNEQYIRLVFEWSNQVLESFSDSHSIAKEISGLFIRKIA